MTTEKLYQILAFVDRLDRDLEIQPKLEAVGNALSNITNQPAQSQHQTALASALTEFDKAASRMRDSITPSQYTLIDGMGGAEFFATNISEKVKESVQMNAMTPSVARDFVQALATHRSEFLTTVRTAHQNLGKL